MTDVKHSGTDCGTPYQYRNEICRDLEQYTSTCNPQQIANNYKQGIVE